MSLWTKTNHKNRPEVRGNTVQVLKRSSRHWRCIGGTDRLERVKQLVALPSTFALPKDYLSFAVAASNSPLALSGALQPASDHQTGPPGIKQLAVRQWPRGYAVFGTRSTPVVSEARDRFTSIIRRRLGTWLVLRFDLTTVQHCGTLPLLKDDLTGTIYEAGGMLVRW